MKSRLLVATAIIALFTLLGTTGVQAKVVRQLVAAPEKIN